MPPKKKVQTIKMESEGDIDMSIGPVVVPEPQVGASERQPDAAGPALPEANVVRAAGLYFAAGDIVISTRDDAEPEDTHRVAFRVDKAFLARHSQVFATKFQSLLAPDTPNLERYDGVPLLVTDDNSEHFEDLLKFMYNPACVIPLGSSAMHR